MNALIVIDPQMVYFTPELLPVADMNTIERIRTLATELGSTEMALIKHVADGTPFERGAVSAMIHPRLCDLNPLVTFEKSYASAFTDTDLGPWLREIVYLERIIICGYQSHHCVVTTALEAAHYAPEVIVVTDACSSPDLTRFDSSAPTPGADVHALAMAACAQFYCKLMDLDAVMNTYG